MWRQFKGRPRTLSDAERRADECGDGAECIHERENPDQSASDAQGGGSRASQTAPESKSLSAAVWGYLESTPGFNAGLRQAEQDLAAGRGTRYEVRGNALRRVQPKG